MVNISSIFSGRNKSKRRAHEAPLTEGSGSVSEPGLSAQPIGDWHYVAEGGANVVFGYHGADERYLGRALRIPKPSETDELESSRIWREELLTRLLPGRLLPGRESVTLDATWVSELLKASEGDRPTKRLEDDQGVWSGSVTALLMDDLRIGRYESGQKVLSVEIKPKWGFMPSAVYVIPPAAATIKSQVSRYRLHQHLRGRIDAYEPLDLYSGDGERMERAIAGLWNIWQDSNGTANSWRVFVDGKLINPDQLDDIPGAYLDTDVVARTAPIILPALKQSGVLERLCYLQSHLDPTDISSLAQRFSAEYPDHPLFDKAVMPEPTTTELREFVDTYLAEPEAGRSNKWTLRESLITYSLSAIFKDCSIFLTIPLVPDGQAWKVASAGPPVKVIDLDLKPLGNMRKWYDLDETIWRYWLDTHPPASTPPTSPGQDAVSYGYETPKPLRGLPDRLYNASTDALFVPTPDRVIDNPIDSPSIQPPTLGLLSGPDTSSTSALFVRTPGGSGRTTPTDTRSIDTRDLAVRLDSASEPAANTDDTVEDVKDGANDGDQRHHG